MAEAFGISKAEIDSMTPDALDETLVILNRTILDERQHLLTLPARTPPPQPTAPPAPPPDELGIPPEIAEQLDPSIVALFKRLSGEISGLKQQIAESGQREKARENESFQRRCDRAFSKHETILGKGSYAELTPNGPELRRRQAVLDTAGRDTSRIPFERKIELAVEALFGGSAPAATITPPAPAAPAPTVAAQPQPTPADLIQRDANGRITGRITPDQWAASRVERPTHRTTAPLPPGTERATQFLKENLAAIDAASTNGTSRAQEEQDLPD
jgi:hypothetical protein